MAIHYLIPHDFLIFRCFDVFDHFIFCSIPTLSAPPIPTVISLHFSRCTGIALRRLQTAGEGGPAVHELVD